MSKSKKRNEMEQKETDGMEVKQETPAETVNPVKEEKTQEQTEVNQDDAKALAESKEKIASLENEVSTLKDQYLRKLADYENFRKRMFREKDDAVQYANTQLLTDLVQILDDFDRAIQASNGTNDFKSLQDGVNIIHNSLLSMLENKYGLSHYDSVNTVFDPNIHEAMMTEQGECEEPVVVEEYIKGYKIRDRVLRSAKVKVRMPVVASQNTNTSTEDA